MTKYRNQITQLAGNLFLTNGGLKTILIFDKGIRTNASSKSHAELDDSVTFDSGSPILSGKL